MAGIVARIPYIDTVVALRTDGDFIRKYRRQKEMEVVRAKAVAKSYLVTDAKAALHAAVKAHDKNRGPWTEAEQMLRKETFREMFPAMKVDALARLIKKIRASN